MRTPRKMPRLMIAAGILLLAATPSLAANVPASPAEPAAHRLGDEPALLSGDARWAGLLVIIIVGGFFLPAAIIGPAQRAVMGEPQDPDESPAPSEAANH